MEIIAYVIGAFSAGILIGLWIDNSEHQLQREVDRFHGFSPRYYKSWEEFRDEKRREQGGEVDFLQVLDWENEIEKTRVN